MSSFTKTIYKIFLVACVVNHPHATEGIEKHVPPWPHKSIDSKVDNIISDDRDGSVFITVRGDIYKYSNELELESSTVQATSGKATRDGIDQLQFTNKILMLIRRTSSDTSSTTEPIGFAKKKNDADLLFSCWQVSDLTIKCWLNKIGELSKASPLLWSNDTRGFKIGPAEHARAITSQVDSNSLIIAGSRSSIEVNATGIQQIPHLPAVGRFKIVKTPKHLVLERRSILPYQSRLEDSDLLFNYLLLFDHNHYTYLILNDIQKSISSSPNIESRLSVKIARVCDNDTDLTSYTEISLTCNNQNNVLAKSAYFDPSQDTPTLYIAFETVDDSTSSTRKVTRKSSVCSYSMNLVRDVFYKATSDCHNGHHASNLLAKLHADSVQPPICQRNPSNPTEWCTSKTNPYIDATSYLYTVKEDIHLTLDNIFSINFLYTTKQGPDLKDVLFIATESGYLTKLGFDGEMFYTLDLHAMQSFNYKLGDRYGSKVLANDLSLPKMTKYSVGSRAIMAITSAGSLSRLDIDACNYYNSCKTCLTTRDPLECVWCGNSCSRRHECEDGRQSTSSCPPIIKRFLPKIGLVSTPTRLRIEGENFGSSKGLRQVKVGDNDCSLDEESSSDEILECICKPVLSSSKENISVTVIDESGPIDSKGSAIAHEPVSFVRVKVYGLHPHHGPASGGSLVSIHGENLDAGVNRTIFLGHLNCRLVELTYSKVTCLTEPQPAAIKFQNTQRLRYLVDGLEQILAPNEYRGGVNLSIDFAYTSELQTISENVLPLDEIEGGNEKLYTIISIGAILIALSLVLIYLSKIEKFPVILKLKVPNIFKSSPDKTVDADLVTFRNPNSSKFINPKPNNGGDSMNGLIKFNGSVMSSDYFGKSEQFEQDQLLITNFPDGEMLSLLEQEKILIDRGRLTLGHVLGSGQFGRVYKGFLKVEETGEHTAVAVKTLHSRGSWDDSLDNRAFLEEGLMMKDFEHENVLELIGVTFDSSGLPMVITPFMLYGDLKSFISDEASSPTVKELIDFGTQIARGMAYLSALKFVHRDLAARNCMLDENMTVKVADFGLSRDIYERDYYSSDNKTTKLPVKWMAIESLEKCIYNTKTDVWSYGILLWELMTRGVVPYPDVDNFDLFSYLKEGRRMLRPRYCPLLLYKIMLACWDENPTKRPTFDELVLRVSDVITELKIAKEGQQKVIRDATYCDVLK